MNTHSKIDAAATRNPLAPAARRGAPTKASGRKQQLLLGAMALLAGTYAFGASPPAAADTVLHNSCTATCTSDGWQPEASLMLGSNGRLYGTAEMGGTYGKGTVFWIKPNGAGYATRYSFGATGDGAYPVAGLLQYGTLVYGTTYEGGQYGYGTVFCMKSSVTAEFNKYSFGSTTTDGTYPQAGLTLVGNWLYGTTAHGGTNGAGTVFRINTKCGQEQVLYNFAGGTDGGFPSGTLFYDSVNNLLYGTTQIGGSGCNCGTVFSVTPAGLESVVYSFTGNPDGSSPRGGVVLDSGSGMLFGTTEYGGQSLGTIFEISPSCANSCGSATVYPFKGPTFSDGLSLRQPDRCRRHSVWHDAIWRYRYRLRHQWLRDDIQSGRNRLPQ